MNDFYFWGGVGVVEGGKNTLEVSAGRKVRECACLCVLGTRRKKTDLDCNTNIPNMCVCLCVCALKELFRSGGGVVPGCVWGVLHQHLIQMQSITTSEGAPLDARNTSPEWYSVLQPRFDASNALEASKVTFWRVKYNHPLLLSASVAFLLQTKVACLNVL